MKSRTSRKNMLCELWYGVKQPLVDLWRFFRHGHGLKLFQIAWNIQLEKWQIASDSVKIFHAVHGRLLAVLGWEINCLKEKRNFFLMQIMLFYFNFSTLAQILKASDCSIWLQTRIEKPDVSSRKSLLCSGDRDTCNFYEPRQELFYWEYFCYQCNSRPCCTLLCYISLRSGLWNDHQRSK